jgi:hypothetical protein
MFWNDPEHCLEIVILIEDDILSIPRQIQVYCICLGFSQASKPVILYSEHTVQLNCSPTWKQSPPKLDLSPVGPGRGQLTARPATLWERPLSRVCNPFPSTGFPGLGRPRDCTPPRGPVLMRPKPSNTGNYL